MIVTITEYDRLQSDKLGTILPIGALRLAGQGLTANGIFAAFNVETRFIRVASDTAIHLRLAGNAAATNQFDYLPANTVEFFAVSGGATASFISA